MKYMEEKIEQLSKIKSTWKLDKINMKEKIKETKKLRIEKNTVKNIDKKD